MTVAAIHQPNFFPWLGYFDKLARADAFVFLDHVQFPKTGGTWTNRVRLLVNGKATWFTAPVDRAFHGMRPISEMAFAGRIGWRSTLLKTLHTAYGKAPFFAEAIALLEPLIMNPTERVAEFNIAAVTGIAGAIGIDAKKIFRSTDLAVSGKATEMLISVTKGVGGTTYLCGGGAQGYQEDEVFAASNINLVYQDYRHPVYLQRGSPEFVPGLSVIDALANLGIADTRRLVLDIHD